MAALAIALPLAACGAPPQIVDIQPGRGAQQVPSNEPIQITFDRPVNQASVAAAFEVLPAVGGELAWPTAERLVFKHQPFSPATDYTVALAAGYADRAGNRNGLRHSWHFHTEDPPELRSTSPGAGERDVDPAAYVAMTFTREIDAKSFDGAIRFEPATSYAVRADPSDAHRLLIAPRALLDPRTTYQLRLEAGGVDVDGNAVRPAQLRFTTGSVRPLSRWISFLAVNPALPGGQSVWMVDNTGFPRRLAEGPAETFTVSSDGRRLLLRSLSGVWTDVQLGGEATVLPFTAEWATVTADGGYVYRAGDRLVRRLRGGDELDVASGVAEVIVNQDGTRVYFVRNGSGGGGIYGYDLGLRAVYRVLSEPGMLRRPRLSTDGSALAYLVDAGGTTAVRAFRFSDGTVRTVASGRVDAAQWLGADLLVIQAVVAVPGIGEEPRLFRVAVASPLATGPLTSLTGALAVRESVAMREPQPSPDGHQIAFLAGDSSSAQLWVMNADGTGVRRLTAFDAESFPFSCAAPHWAAG